MSKLREMIEQELKERDHSKLDPFDMHQAANGARYRKLSEAPYEPTVGTIGNFSTPEKIVMRGIAYVAKEESSDPEFKSAYKTIYDMVPGSVARLRVKERDFYVAAFPTNNLVSPLVLFVNSHDRPHRLSFRKRVGAVVGKGLNRMNILLY
jgi:hypothetical protein